jgi:hypothetical protein
MRKLLITYILMAILFYCTESMCADWKFAGGFGSKNDKRAVFYESDNIEYLPNGNAKVWTMSVKASKLEDAQNGDYKDMIIENSANKIAHAYYPPSALVNPKFSYNDLVDAIIFEETVNTVAIKEDSKILFEVSCKERTVRNVSAIVYSDDGDTKSSHKTGEWDEIIPESNMDTIHKILCQNKHNKK